MDGVVFTHSPYLWHIFHVPEFVVGPEVTVVYEQLLSFTKCALEGSAVFHYLLFEGTYATLLQLRGV